MEEQLGKNLGKSRLIPTDYWCIGLADTVGRYGTPLLLGSPLNSFELSNVRRAALPDFMGFPQCFYRILSKRGWLTVGLCANGRGEDIP